MRDQDTYQYDEVAADEIRLLRLRPGDPLAIIQGDISVYRLISEEDREDPPQTAAFRVDRNVALVNPGDYDALSYYWGDEEPTTHIEIYDEQNAVHLAGCIPIKPNLEAALKQFRTELSPRDDGHYFWVDAICINQKNKAEKSAQIRRMAAIYNGALRVRIWLGNGSPSSDTAMNFINELVRLEDIDQLSTHPETDHKWAAFRDLMRCKWFSRRWIIQEVALAREPFIYYGDKEIPWETFTYAVALFTAKALDLKRLFRQSKLYEYDSDFLGDLEPLGAKTLVDITNNLFRKSEDGDILEHLLSLEQLMANLSMFETSTPHDIIYAVLSLAHDAAPGIARKSAANWKENIVTPLPSPVETRDVPFSTYQNPAINVIIDEQPLEYPPTHFSPKLKPQEVQASNLLKPSDHRRTRSRANSLALRRAEQDIAVPPKRITVDYEMTVFEVCKDFIQFAITHSRSLDIICKPWAPSPTSDKPEPPLPTWIPHISGRAYQLVPGAEVYQRVRADSLVGTPGSGIRSYRACGKKRAYNSDPSKDKKFIIHRTLLAEGFVLDKVSILGEQSSHGIIPRSWLDLVDWEDSNEKLPQEFWRTLVADRAPDGTSAPPAYFPLVCKWAFKQRTPHFDLSTAKLLDQGRCPDLSARFLRRVQAVVWDRRMLRTQERSDGTSKETSSLLALAPGSTQEGDLICILYGCSVPVVLRKRIPGAPIKPKFKRRSKPKKAPRNRG